MKSDRVIVIGAGVFGHMAAAALRSIGWEVVVYDSPQHRKNSGSVPSAGLMKPTWLMSEVVFGKGLTKHQIEDSLELVDRFYGTEEYTFHLPLKRTWNIVRMNMERLLAASYSEGTATKVAPGRAWITDGKQSWCEEGVIIVAAGYQSRFLVDGLQKMKGKRGVAFYLRSPQLTQDRIIPWAPYKIIKAIHLPGGEYWCGDSTSILQEHWSLFQEETSLNRVKSKLGLKTITSQRSLTGVRPDLPEGFRRLDKNLFLCTGANKNGCAMSGVYARLLMEALS